MKRFLKVIVPIVGMVVGAYVIAACGGLQSSPKHAAASATSSRIYPQNATEIEQQVSNRQLATYMNNQPVHNYTYSQLRQNLLDLEDAQAHTTQTTSFFFNQGVQNPVQSCPSIGFPIASDTQLTNPNQITNNNGGAAWDVVGNADPTGVYTGQTTGTYVICVNAQGQAYADYWEGFVQTVAGPATWDTTSHSVKLIGPPTAAFSNGKS